MYVMEEDFIFNGTVETRRGVIAAVRLEDYETGHILPHEHTRKEWVDERVGAMADVMANYSPMLTVFQEDASERDKVSDVLAGVVKIPPDLSAEPSYMQSVRIWPVSNPDTVKAISKIMLTKRLVIADGHHRYEAALKFQREMRQGHASQRDSSFNYRMMLLTPSHEPGLITRGYHRTIENAGSKTVRSIMDGLASTCDLEEWHTLKGERLSDSVVRFVRSLGEKHSPGTVFGVCTGNPPRFVKAQVKLPKSTSNETANSDYGVLHKEIFARFLGDDADEVVAFRHDPVDAAASLEKGEAQAVFFMRPLPIGAFMRIAEERERLPQKATNFYPKPLAGCVIQSLKGEL